MDTIGEAVTNLQVGDQVVGFLPMVDDGASAEYAIAAADILAPAPTSIPLADAAALPLVGLTAYQALFIHAELKEGQRVLINGADGAVGGYAVQLAKSAGAHVIATASPRSSDEVKANGADEVIDYTSTEVAAVVTQPVDVLINLAPIDPDQFTALVAVVRDGGVVVSTTVWMPTPGDANRGVRGIDLFVNSDAKQLSQLVGRVDRGELTVNVGERISLDQLPSLHMRAAAGTLHGKVLVVPATS